MECGEKTKEIRDEMHEYICEALSTLSSYLKEGLDFSIVDGEGIKILPRIIEIYMESFSDY